MDENYSRADDVKKALMGGAAYLPTVQSKEWGRKSHVPELCQPDPVLDHCVSGVHIHGKTKTPCKYVWRGKEPRKF